MCLLWQTHETHEDSAQPLQEMLEVSATEPLRVTGPRTRTRTDFEKCWSHVLTRTRTRTVRVWARVLNA